MRDAPKKELRGLGEDLAKSLMTLGFREFVAWIRRRRAARRARR